MEVKTEKHAWVAIKWKQKRSIKPLKKQRHIESSK